ncbi:MAG: hypothetical protein CME63_03925 [Halobacteriovoraceae bacterium]|nr:hypothetical protein [Halobacteriovoraceae bacterium]
MEGLIEMIKYSKILFIMSFIFFSRVEAKEEISRVVYFNHLFGHVHKNPSRYSQSLSTIECGHPVKIVKEKGNEILSGNYFKVKVGPYLGYIDRIYLSNKKEKCISDKYPKFFNSLNLSISEMYYWGKLNDQYVQGESKVQ